MDGNELPVGDGKYVPRENDREEGTVDTDYVNGHHTRSEIAESKDDAPHNPVDYKLLHDESQRELSEKTENFQKQLINMISEFEDEVNSLKKRLNEDNEAPPSLNINKAVYHPKCSDGICRSDEDEHKLECTQCKNLFHYSCTQLPLYQLAHFLIRGYRKYLCSVCTTIPDYVKETMASKSKLQWKTKTEIEQNSVACQTGSGFLREEEKMKNQLALKEGELSRIYDDISKQKNVNVLLRQKVKILEEQDQVMQRKLKAQGDVIVNMKNKD